MKRPLLDIASSAQLVARLVADQHPALAGPVVATAEGWDNTLYRLGDALVVRVPRREVAVPLLLNEQRWLPALAAALPVAIPAPVAVGVPSERFPWPWSITPWIEGAGLDELAAADRDRAVDSVAEALVALHRPAPADAPRNPVRGVPLRARVESWAGYRAQADLDAEDLARVEAALCDGLDADEWTAPPVWLHGDLHPANTLVDAHGDLAALIDFGDLGAGDPATDLSVAWLGFGTAGRTRLISRLTASGAYDEHVWRRARAWAAGLSLAFLAHSDDAPRMAAIGRHALAQLRE
jgi:aminoglycoside phosphotransferase (APT) family kinase protein